MNRVSQHMKTAHLRIELTLTMTEKRLLSLPVHILAPAVAGTMRESLKNCSGVVGRSTQWDGQQFVVENGDRSGRALTGQERRVRRAGAHI